MAYLEQQISSGSQRIDLSPNQGSKLTVGRNSDNVLSISDDNLISRFHCEIVKTAEGYLLRDLDSSNGTMVQGMKIVKVLLSDGLEFTVGNTYLKFFANQDRASLPDATEPLVGEPAPELPRATGHDNQNADAQIRLDVADPFTPEDDEVGSKGAGPDYHIGSIDALATVGHDVPFDVTAISMINARGQTVHAASDVSQDATAATLMILRLLLYGCVRAAASDIHIEPKRDGSLVRLRIDGTMVEVAGLAGDAAKRLHSLIKVLCDIDMTKKAIVQEGHFSSKVPGRRVDYRVSFTPSMFGQKLVVRVLDPANSPQQLRDLKLPDWMYAKIRTTAKQDTGMLLICGPTGSGKTTSLYAVLRQIDARARNVLTIEDPVEYEVAGVTQIPVDEDRGATFSSLLRSCLRQDPDVIVLGEIRDRDTATTAMQAATTGHLVFSTTHAKDSIGTVFRLLDLGVEPYLIASTLNLVLAQRLVRKLCPHCKIARKATPQQVMKLQRTVQGVEKLYIPGGCAKCFGTGFAGRRGVFELLVATDELRDVIIKSPDIAAIKKSIELSMFQSLTSAGFDLVLSGETPMEEIARVIGFD